MPNFLDKSMACGRIEQRIAFKSVQVGAIGEEAAPALAVISRTMPMLSRRLKAPLSP